MQGGESVRVEWVSTYDVGHPFTPITPTSILTLDHLQSDDFDSPSRIASINIYSYKESTIDWCLNMPDSGYVDNLELGTPPIPRGGFNIKKQAKTFLRLYSKSNGHEPTPEEQSSRRETTQGWVSDPNGPYAIPVKPSSGKKGDKSDKGKKGGKKDSVPGAARAA